MIASYSALLLEAWKPNLRAYSIYIPSGEVRIRPAPLPWALAAPSTDNLQMGRLSTSWVASVDFTRVNSMMKSAKICPFTVVLGLYLMSNSISSITHFISLPEVYDYAVFASSNILLGLRRCELGSKVEVFWM